MTIGGSASGNSRRRLRLGMVGGGPGAFIGAVHRIAARMDDRYELVAGALSSDPERSRAGAQELRIAPDRAYGSFQEMASAEAKRSDRIDAVAVVTPNHLHYPIAKAFLEAGIHVICDKPVTTTIKDAVDLGAIVRRMNLVFGLTHNYTATPMVRQARQMIRAGELGTIRVVQVEYAQDWLVTPLEKTGHKQAAWRTDPAQTGQGGCLGDIGTHAFNLAEFVTGLRCEQLAAEVCTYVPGRRVDDGVQMLLRFNQGVRGMLWACQVATGNENNLRLRVYGDKAGVEWKQEAPNYLWFTPQGKAPVQLSRSGPGATSDAIRASRVPMGHPEGYLEAFAQLYTDLAEQISAKIEGRSPDPAALLVPAIDEGVAEMRFIAAAVESSKKNSAWISLADMQ
ncbi:MAG TPA: Gfo/Idh/MocA family oxidoreductase [Candidatus Sulfotelmatobacter sp.]|nr:Gfo/Idh/MocA family oxidoreductase [Candidatus Sulfotelmatobacter sp.]